MSPLARQFRDRAPLQVGAPSINPIADAYTGAIVTLDGEEAIISGRLLPFARVSTFQPRARSIEYAWETVEYVMLNKGGEFRS